MAGWSCDWLNWWIDWQAVLGRSNQRCVAWLRGWSVLQQPVPVRLSQPSQSPGTRYSLAVCLLPVDETLTTAAVRRQCLSVCSRNIRYICRSTAAADCWQFHHSEGSGATQFDSRQTLKNCWVSVHVEHAVSVDLFTRLFSRQRQVNSTQLLHQLSQQVREICRHIKVSCCGGGWIGR